MVHYRDKIKLKNVNPTLIIHLSNIDIILMFIVILLQYYKVMCNIILLWLYYDVVLLIHVKSEHLYY